MAPVTPQQPDAHQQLFESYLTYLRAFDRGSAHQQEHVRLHVLPALGHCVSAVPVGTQPNVVAVPPVAVVDDKYLVKKEDLNPLCAAWHSEKSARRYVVRSMTRKRMSSLRDWWVDWHVASICTWLLL